MNICHEFCGAEHRIVLHPEQGDWAHCEDIARFPKEGPIAFIAVTDSCTKKVPKGVYAVDKVKNVLMRTI